MTTATLPSWWSWRRQYRRIRSPARQTALHRRFPAQPRCRRRPGKVSTRTNLSGFPGPRWNAMNWKRCIPIRHSRLRYRLPSAQRQRGRRWFLYWRRCQSRPGVDEVHNAVVVVLVEGSVVHCVGAGDGNLQVGFSGLTWGRCAARRRSGAGVCRRRSRHGKEHCNYQRQRKKCFDLFILLFSL